MRDGIIQGFPTPRPVLTPTEGKQGLPDHLGLGLAPLPRQPAHEALSFRVKPHARRHTRSLPDHAKRPSWAPAAPVARRLRGPSAFPLEQERTELPPRAHRQVFRPILYAADQVPERFVCRLLGLGLLLGAGKGKERFPDHPRLGLSSPPRQPVDEALGLRAE